MRSYLDQRIDENHCQITISTNHSKRVDLKYFKWQQKGHPHWEKQKVTLREGNGNPLQCSCLENPRDGGAWWAAIYGVAQSQTRLKWLSSSSSQFITQMFISKFKIQQNQNVLPCLPEKYRGTCLQQGQRWYLEQNYCPPRCQKLAQHSRNMQKGNWITRLVECSFLHWVGSQSPLEEEEHIKSMVFLFFF